MLVPRDQDEKTSVPTVAHDVAGYLTLRFAVSASTALQSWDRDSRFAIVSDNVTRLSDGPLSSVVNYFEFSSPAQWRVSQCQRPAVQVKDEERKWCMHFKEWQARLSVVELGGEDAERWPTWQDADTKPQYAKNAVYC
ncbi:hypothetical protein BaRGS_00010855 [Batillaria attramentaria]|uniref:Uncharacterized protein n=1 Tax=Batillaria attramentaria TaxID=370345 RepID=A0ABD0LEH0_9CAEN